MVVSYLSSSVLCILVWSHVILMENLCCSIAVMLDSLWPHELQHSRLPCPSLSLRVCSKSCPLGGWCPPTISSSVTPFSSCPQSFPASESFPVGQLFASGGQIFGTSASAWSFQLIFRVDFLYDWLIWSCCPRDSQESSSAPQFESINSMVLSLFYGPILTSLASLVAQMVKNLPVMRDTKVLSLGLEDSLAKQMATHSSILAWRVPWTEESGKLQSIGSQRIGHDWVTNTHTIHTHIHTWLLEKP